MNFHLQLRLCTSSLATAKDVILEISIVRFLDENTFDIAHASQAKTFTEPVTDMATMDRLMSMAISILRRTILKQRH